MRRMYYFANDMTFLPGLGNALSKEFSLDLHCRYFVVSNDENTKFLIFRKCFHMKEKTCYLS